MNLCRDCAHWSPEPDVYQAPWHTCTNKKLPLGTMCGCSTVATAETFGCVMWSEKTEEEGKAEAR